MLTCKDLDFSILASMSKSGFVIVRLISSQRIAPLTPMYVKVCHHSYLSRPKNRNRDSSTTSLSNITMLTQPTFTPLFCMSSGTLFDAPLPESSSTHPPNSTFSTLFSVINVGHYQFTRNCSCSPVTSRFRNSRPAFQMVKVQNSSYSRRS